MIQLTELLNRAKTSTALVDLSSGKTVNFLELHSVIDHCASQLQDRGLTPGDTVAGVFEPSQTFSIYYLACVKLGLDYLAVPVDSSDSQLKNIMGRNEIHHFLSGSLRDISNLNVDTVIDPSRDLMPDDPVEPTMEDRSREHSLLIRTSGTTGTPKVVELLWRNLIESARSSQERLGKRSDDLWLAPLPVHHIGGIAPLLRGLYNGTTTGFEPYSPETIRKRLRNHPITIVSLVPTMLRDLIEAGLHGEETQLRTVLVGGAPAEAELVESALAHDVPIHTTYGMTETASQIATARPSELKETPETVGNPLENVKLEIDETAANTSDTKEIGEIVVEGPMVAKRYRHTDDQEQLNHPRFRTGDLGYRNEYNQLHVVGRQDRGILTGGELVHPRKIEKTLNALDRIEDSHVLGLPDDRLGKKIVSVLVPSSGTRPDPESIYRTLQEKLLKHELPDELYIFETLPRTPSGTIDERGTRETLNEQDPFYSQPER